MQGLHSDNRGAMQFTGVVMTIAVLLTAVVMAPFIYTFAGMASTGADPLTGFLLQLVAPMLFLSVIIGAGMSVRRGS